MRGKHKLDGQHERPKPAADDHEQQAGSEQVAGAGGRSRRMLLITLAVCLFVAAAGVSVAMLSSPSRGQAGRQASAGNSPVDGQTPAPQPTATVPSSRASTGPQVAGDRIAKSALRWPPRLKHQILRWEAGAGGKALAAVQEQMGYAMQAVGLKLYAPARAACMSLASDVSTARAGPPIPDNAMQRLYAKALAGISRATADCRAAIWIRGDESVQAHVNEALLNQSRAEFAAMSKTLYQATGEIWAMHR